ncbi:hypothetical protein QBC39DRAFT_362005 [Podospora conica]|nr:hypothetical protein QBC39DRAFT_362005 [Schizothecium conicum]
MRIADLHNPKAETWDKACDLLFSTRDVRVRTIKRGATRDPNVSSKDVDDVLAILAKPSPADRADEAGADNDIPDDNILDPDTHPLPSPKNEQPEETKSEPDESNWPPLPTERSPSPPPLDDAVWPPKTPDKERDTSVEIARRSDCLQNRLGSDGSLPLDDPLCPRNTPDKEQDTSVEIPRRSERLQSPLGLEHWPPMGQETTGKRLSPWGMEQQGMKHRLDTGLPTDPRHAAERDLKRRRMTLHPAGMDQLLFAIREDEDETTEVPEDETIEVPEDETTELPDGSKSQDAESTGMADQSATSNEAGASMIHECLLSPTSWLTAGSITSLLERVSAASPFSVCVANVASMESELTQYMLYSANGCLEAATTSAESILVPIHLDNKHWSLALVPLTEHDPIELFDSLPSFRSGHDPKVVVARFLGQLNAIWPKEAGARVLPAALQRDPPFIVTGVCPAQPNNYDCGVSVVVTALYLILKKRFPAHHEFGIWRRLLSFLSGSLPLPPPSRREIEPLLSMHQDWSLIDPKAPADAPQPPCPKPGATLDDLERYCDDLRAHAELVKKHIGDKRAQRAGHARRLEEPLVHMHSVMRALSDRLTLENPEVAGVTRILQAERASMGAGGSKHADDLEDKIFRARRRIANAVTHVKGASGVAKQALDGIHELLRASQEGTAQRIL